MMAWLYLLLAGLCEIGWPLGLKLSADPDKRLWGIGLALVALAISGYLLWLAQKHIPIGTAYAVWTGIGAAGTCVVGIALFNDPATLTRYLGVAMIVGGVILLKVGG